MTKWGWVALTVFAGVAARADGNCADLGAKFCAYSSANSDKPFLEGSDGTFEYNPAYYRKNPEPPQPLNDDDYAKYMDLIDVPGLSLETKTVLADSAPALFDPKATFSVRWPLGNPKAQYKDVSDSDMLAALKTSLGDDRFNQLQALAKPLADGQAQFNSQTKPMQAWNDKLTDFYKNPQEVATRTARVKQIFDFAMQSVLDTITRGVRDPSKWSAEQRNMVTRVQGISMNLMSMDQSSRSNACKTGGMGNANYTVGTHTFVVCAGVPTLPDAQMVNIFAHELGHAVDPCAMEGDYSKFDKTKLQAMIDSSQVSAADKKVLMNNVLGKDGGSYLSPELLSFINDGDFEKKAVAAGALTVLEPGSTTLPSLYADTYSCLAKNYGMRSPQPQDAANDMTALQAALASYSSLTPEQKQNAINNVSREHRLFPQCDYFYGPKTQMIETMADVFGVVAKDKFLRENPPKTDLDKMLTIRSTQACDFSNLIHQQEIGESANAMMQLQNAPNTQRLTSNEHPSDVLRARLEADLPGLADVYGCTRDSSHCMDSLVVPYGDSTTGSSGVKQ